MTQTSIFTKAAAWVALVGVLAIGAVMLFGSLSSSTSGNVGSESLNTGNQQTDPWGFGAGVQIGAPSNTGPILRMVSAGTCNLVDSSLPFAASTTQAVTCSPGSSYNYRSTDMVFVSLSGVSTSAYGVITDVGPSYVSTTGTSPIITTYLYNATGASTSTFQAATTSANFVVYRVL